LTSLYSGAILRGRQDEITPFNIGDLKMGAMVKVQQIAVYKNNNTRNMHNVKVNAILENDLMKVVCGTCESGDIEMLKQLAEKQNKMAGMGMAVGCFVSDRPLSQEEIAEMVMRQGGAKLMQKRMLANARQNRIGRVIMIEGE
jgi:hypothetical protein